MEHWLLLNDAPAFGPGISLVRILDLQHRLRRATSVVDEILVQHSVALRRVSSHIVIWVLQVIAAFELKPLLQNESETLWTASDLPSTLGAWPLVSIPHAGTYVRNTYRLCRSQAFFVGRMTTKRRNEKSRGRIIARERITLPVWTHWFYYCVCHMKMCSAAVDCLGTSTGSLDTESKAPKILNLYIHIVEASTLYRTKADDSYLR